VVVLGPTGRNFGAGMANGVAYVWDPEHTFDGRINTESVLVQSVDDAGAEIVHNLIQRHVQATGSERGARLLADWETGRHQFRQVVGKAALELAAQQADIEEGAAD